MKLVKEVKIVKEVEIVKEVKIVKEVIFDFSPPQSKALLLLNLFNWYEYFRFKRILIKHINSNGLKLILKGFVNL